MDRSISLRQYRLELGSLLFALSLDENLSLAAGVAHDFYYQQVAMLRHDSPSCRFVINLITAAADFQNSTSSLSSLTSYSSTSGLGSKQKK